MSRIPSAKDACCRVCSFSAWLHAARRLFRWCDTNWRMPLALACWRSLAASRHPAVAKVGRERLRMEISRFMGKNGRWTRAVIVRIPSCRFLRMTTPNDRFMNRIRREAARFDPMLFENFGPLEDSLPYLELALSGEGSKLKTVIVQHEGRHRAASVMDAGGHDIPVVLFYGKKSPVNGDSMRGIKVHGQFGRGSFVIREAASMMYSDEEEVLRVANGLPKRLDGTQPA